MMVWWWRDVPVLAAGDVLVLLVSFPPEAPAPLSPPLPEDPPEADIVPSTSSNLRLLPQIVYFLDPGGLKWNLCYD